MITVEGLYGNGTLWGLFRCPTPMVVEPVSISNYCKRIPYVNATFPAAYKVPPVTAESVWFDTQLTGYGCKADRIDIGYLKGTTSPEPYYPCPCEQSTIQGGVLAFNPGMPLRWTLENPAAKIDSKNWYLPNGKIAYFANGRPTNSTIHKAYAASGDKVSFSISSANADLWNADFPHYTDWTHSADSNVPVRYGNGGPADQWYSSIPINVDFPSATTMFRSTCTHPSEDVWVVEFWGEYHHNSSYVPRAPLGTSGYGFIVAAVHRKFIIKQQLIQARSAVHFRLSCEVEQTSEWWGHQTGTTNPPRFAGSGKLTYGYLPTICILEPGRISPFIFHKEVLDEYCEPAKERAKLLFHAKDAKISRSLAIADAQALDSNWIENLSQVPGTLECVSPLIEGWNALKSGNPVGVFKALASAFLVWSYQIKPALADYDDLHSNLGSTYDSITRFRFSNERRRGALNLTCPVLDGIASLDYFTTYHFVLKDDSFSTIWNALERLNLDPSGANAWDLIPFSFVVDWFMKIGSALDRIASYNSAVTTKNCKSRVETFRVTWPVSGDQLDLKKVGRLNELAITSPLKYRWYDRRIYYRVGVIDPFAGQKASVPTSNQMAQGGALLTNFLP